MLYTYFIEQNRIFIFFSMDEPGHACLALALNGN